MGFFERHPSVLGDQRRQSREYQAYLDSLAYQINNEVTMKQHIKQHEDLMQLLYKVPGVQEHMGSVKKGPGNVKGGS